MLATQIEINGDDIAKKEKIGINKMFIDVVHVTNIFSCKQDFTIKIFTYSISKVRILIWVYLILYNKW